MSPARSGPAPSRTRSAPPESHPFPHAWARLRGGAHRTPTVAAGAGRGGFTPPISAHVWLYFALRRGGGGRRDRHIFCHGGFHHACHRTHPQHVRDRPVLLADLHPRCLRLAVLRRTDGRHGGGSTPGGGAA